MLSVVRIIEGTSVDGPGLRTSIYLAGCSHHCSGCHNPETWDIKNGTSMTVNDIMQIVIQNDFNVTLTGGDPFFQAREVIPLLENIKALKKNIWCYTGYTFEQILASRNADFLRLLSLIDVLVDGPFVQTQRNLDLRFRGSENQRLVDCCNSSEKRIVEWKENE